MLKRFKVEYINLYKNGWFMTPAIGIDLSNKGQIQIAFGFLFWGIDITYERD